MEAEEDSWQSVRATDLEHPLRPARCHGEPQQPHELKGAPDLADGARQEDPPEVRPLERLKALSLTS